MLWSDAPTTVPTPEEPTRVEADPAAAGPGLGTDDAEGPPDSEGPGVAEEVSVVAADEAFLAEMAAEFDAIEVALARLDDGSFERCQVCGGRIGEERLMADPLVTRCRAHA